MQESVEQVTVHDDVIGYVVSLATATRTHPKVVVGASPRAELDLVQLARAQAVLNGRDFVLPEDVKAPAVPAIGHRVTLRPEMWVRNLRGPDVVAQLLAQLPAPRAPWLMPIGLPNRPCNGAGAQLHWPTCSSPAPGSR